MRRMLGAGAVVLFLLAALNGGLASDLAGAGGLVLAVGLIAGLLSGNRWLIGVGVAALLAVALSQIVATAVPTALLVGVICLGLFLAVGGHRRNPRPRRGWW